MGIGSMSTSAVGRSQSEFKHLQRFVVGETRLARGSQAYLRRQGEEGQAWQAWCAVVVPKYLDRARILVTELAGMVISTESIGETGHPRTHSAAASPQLDPERARPARLTRLTRQALPLDGATRNGTAAVGALSCTVPSVSKCHLSSLEAWL